MDNDFFVAHSVNISEPMANDKCAKVVASFLGTDVPRGLTPMLSDARRVRRLSASERSEHPRSIERRSGTHVCWSAPVERSRWRGVGKGSFNGLGWSVDPFLFRVLPERR